MTHRRKARCWRYLLGHAGKDVHAGYGEPWLKTLKAAIEIIPNPPQAPIDAAADGSAACQT
jgi:hypothetical protein